ncbi:hypothetical protein GEMRC1_005586 [Eukaryota sp. GEM-RC1]
MDVKYFQTRLSEQFQHIIKHDQPFPLSQKKVSKNSSRRSSKASLYSISFLLFLFLFLLVLVSLDTGILSRFTKSNSLRFLETSLVVCLFDAIGRKLTYFFTSDLPAPERDSFRLWYVLLIKLCFFSVPILYFLDAESSCFHTDFGFYVFCLFLLTFFFDVIFPFFWYKCRSLSKSFIKPLFDLPLSQAKLCYYYVLTFAANFYVPTFALISLPLIYLYGKYLSYSLRKCSRLPSATYNQDQVKNCVTIACKISGLYVSSFYVISFFVKFSCGSFKGERLVLYSVLCAFLIIFASLGAVISHDEVEKSADHQLKNVLKLHRKSVNVLYGCANGRFKGTKLHGV